MTHLADSSAEQIQKLWSGAAQISLTQYEEIQNKLASYEKVDQPRVVLTRREQPCLRQRLFRGGEIGTCAICGESLPVSFLVAAHIKPRVKCNDTERRDYMHHVLPMCLLGCDALFERGWLIVKEGTVCVRKRDHSSESLQRLLRHVDGRAFFACKTGRIKYFEWHGQNAKESLRLQEAR